MIQIGQGFDVHQLVPQRPLVIGGVTLPYERGLLGHSDAGVLTYAIIDVILDAAGLGDIGQLFSETDPQLKNADSVNLLKKVDEEVRRSGFTIGNIDCTILAGGPKMNPYLAEMKKNLAASCHLAVTQVNIKATTMKAMGFIDKKEGIGAIAIALLGKQPEATLNRLFLKNGKGNEHDESSCALRTKSDWTLAHWECKNSII